MGATMPATAGMVFVPGGEFIMGSDRHYPEEAPAHPVRVDGFHIDARPVTNAAFAAFVAATGHVTLAERAPSAEDYPGADPALLVPASSVFTPPPGPVPLHDAYRWWSLVPGADWRHPQGPDSDLSGLDDHPVVHVAWQDVAAYAAWAGKEPPTEAEWEYAARGGLAGADYAWGDELTPGGRHLANVWQGPFPHANTEDDGYRLTSPAGAFPANGFGLYDMIGNVWEWTADPYGEHRAAQPAPSCCGTAPGPDGIPRKVIKGGSYLCAPSYCRRYRPAARQPQAVDTSTAHVGFRCVLRSAHTSE